MLGIVIRAGNESGGPAYAAMLSLEFFLWTGHGRFGLSDCFEAAGFENYVAVIASAPEECDSAEGNEGVLFAALALGYGEEVNWAGLEEAWRSLENHSVVPNGVTLQDLLYADSCVVAAEEVSDDSVVQDVFRNLQGNPGSYTDAEGETPSNIGVAATRYRLDRNMPCNSYGHVNAA